MLKRQQIELEALQRQHREEIEAFRQRQPHFAYYPSNLDSQCCDEPQSPTPAPLEAFQTFQYIPGYRRAPSTTGSLLQLAGTTSQNNPPPGYYFQPAATPLLQAGMRFVYGAGQEILAPVEGELNHDHPPPNNPPP